MIQAIGMAYGLRVAVNNPTFFSYLTIVVSLTAGTILLMWIGEQITARGIGNGISLIISLVSFQGFRVEWPLCTGTYKPEPSTSSIS